MLELFYLCFAFLSIATTFTTGAGNNKRLYATDPLGLNDARSLGINCRGSTLCPWFSSPLTRVNIYLQQWMTGALADADVYAPYKHIACAPTGVGARAFCAFTTGVNIPAAGINGALIKTKMKELQNHGCFACGGVPISDDNDPNKMGIFKIDFVWNANCSDLPGRVICDPTTKGVGLNGSAIGNWTQPDFRLFDVPRTTPPDLVDIE